jgi:hypothetical protein
VLVGVEHRDQNIKVRQQVLQGDILGDFHRVVGTLAPLWKLLIKRMVFGTHLVSKRLEESAYKLLTATPGEDGDSRSQRLVEQWNGYEFRVIFTVPR